ncbi:MAG TPA: ATP-dependent dethiobiotin synthetase BioD, partial [Gordonia sp. (in: high G+C Gram-positive bacteria)]|nr:ATP-dependent dethiobiotin synthetase BioD [Gordonia sp. (in: high G+C Gram-positive bacteria)]
GLGALNHAELTVDAIRARGLTVAGLIIGAWPSEPDLAMTCNRDDLPRLTGVPVVGVIPDGAGTLSPDDFRAAAPAWFDPDWIAAARLDPRGRGDRLLDPRGRSDRLLDPRGRSDEGARVTRGPATRPPDPTTSSTTTAPSPTDHPNMTGVLQ